MPIKQSTKISRKMEKRGTTSTPLGDESESSCAKRKCVGGTAGAISGMSVGGE